MNQIALQMIEAALDQLTRIGRRIESLRLIVSGESTLAMYSSVNTVFGELQIEVGGYVPKGYSYIIEEPTGGKPRAFQWVTKPMKKRGGNEVA